MPPTPDPGPHDQRTIADKADIRAMARNPAQAFRFGFVQCIPMLFVIVPFGVLFGVVAREAGLDFAQVMGFSVLVLAGASQFTAVQLLTDHAPVWIVLLSSLAVNLRMAMYSASIAPWLRGTSAAQKSWIAYTLLDQSYALAFQHFENHPKLTLAQRIAYYSGVSAALCVTWPLATWVGAIVGSTIPESIALDFALPITFLAMIAPMLRTIAHMAACFVSIVTALALAGLPSGTGLIPAALLGMATGAVVETLIGRKKAAG